MVLDAVGVVEALWDQIEVGRPVPGGVGFGVLAGGGVCLDEAFEQGELVVGVVELADGITPAPC